MLLGGGATRGEVCLLDGNHPFVVDVPEIEEAYACAGGKSALGRGYYSAVNTEVHAKFIYMGLTQNAAFV